jgi:hypothetical protein
MPCSPGMTIVNTKGQREPLGAGRRKLNSSQPHVPWHLPIYGDLASYLTIKWTGYQTSLTFGVGEGTAGGGREMPPALPALCQQRHKDDEGEDKYSMILSQVRSMGGGPPTRNITFSLERNTAQPPPPVTQSESPFEDFGGGNNAAINQPQCKHGMPLGGLENTNALGMGVGAALATATGTSPYSGFNNAIKKWGMGTKASIARDLKWQHDVGGNPQKTTQFKEVVGGLQDFHTYLFMKPGSAFVTVMHSPMKFVAISEATQHLQGRFIGFVGDRTPTKDPILIVLSQQKTWSWETKTVSTDAAAMDAYYAEDSTWRGKLWAPPTGKAGGEAAVKAPILLAIPLVLFQVIWDEKRALMTHDIHALTVAIVTNFPDVEKARTDWELVLSWCLMALQMNTSGNSHLSLVVEAVTEGDDDYFVRWIDQRLNSTFGPRTGKGSTGHNDRGGMALLAHNQAQVLTIMASEVGKGVALGLWAAGHLHRDVTNIGGGYNSEGGKG